MRIHPFLAITLLILAVSCSREIENQEDSNAAPERAGTEVVDCNLRNGDIIFQTSNSGQSLAIQLATNSRYSHVGIVFLEGNDTLVLEAVQPVQLCAFRKWVNRGDNGTYRIKRLKTKEGTIDANEMLALGKSYIDKDYDILFGWGDDKFYCSELVYKLYLNAGFRLCELKPLSSYDLEAAYVQKMLKKRYGINIPLDQEMVSPGDIYESDKLMEISPCPTEP